MKSSLSTTQRSGLNKAAEQFAFSPTSFSRFAGLWGRHAKQAFLFVVIGGLLVACGSPSGQQRRPDYGQIPSTDEVPGSEDALSPHHMGGRQPIRVAMLLPLSGSSKDSREVAQSLLDAAQLAIFDASNPNLLLIPKDTQGTAAGAKAAARQAIDEGAEIILGPLFSTSVAAVTPVAQRRGIPVVAFSTDRDVSKPGIYLLSFLPEYEIERITDFAVVNGFSRFAAMIPQTAYGQRVLSAFEQSVTGRAAFLIQTESYHQSVDAMFEPARRLAAINSFDAVLLPEGGTNLRGLAPLLPYFDVDPRQVKFLGTGLWDDPTLGREPSLVGGWFAAPPPRARTAFSERFEGAFGRKPPRIASLGYDSIGLTAALAGQLDEIDRFSEAALTNPNGFTGVDGIFRFLPDGSTERGLAVIEVTSNGFKVIDEAPQTFEQPSF